MYTFKSMKTTKSILSKVKIMSKSYKRIIRKRKLVSKKLMDYIDKVAKVQKCTTEGIDDREEYVSKLDGSFLTFVGMEENLKYLMDRGITEGVQSIDGGRVACIGFSPKDQKWYGWSHRAIFCFKIGHTIDSEKIGFEPSNEEEHNESCLNFWADDFSNASDDKKVETVVRNGVKGSLVTYTYDDEVPNKKLRGTKYENFTPFPDKWGKGEWTAKTLEDAKQMAIDFARDIG